MSVHHSKCVNEKVVCKVLLGYRGGRSHPNFPSAEKIRESQIRHKAKALELGFEG